MSIKGSLRPEDLPEERIMNALLGFCIVMYQTNIHFLKTRIKLEPGRWVISQIRSQLSIDENDQCAGISFSLEVEDGNVWYDYEMSIDIEDLDGPVNHFINGSPNRLAQALFNNHN